MNRKLEQLIQTFKQHNFPVTYVKDTSELHDQLKAMIEPGSVVRDGGSQTLIETGTVAFLQSLDVDYISHNDPSITKERDLQAMREAFHSDVFLCSVNAITQNGELYNVDGNGNRVAATIFGPKKVILVVGTNKIVKDMEEAKKRIQTIAAVKNCQRLNKQTPCQKVGKCVNCLSNERICRSHVKIDYQTTPRIHILLIEGDYGY